MARPVNPIEIARRMRKWLAEHPKTTTITVPMMQRELGGPVYMPPHIVEQAMERLNKSGELSHAAGPSKRHCCGDCRAAHYHVRRKKKRRG